LNLELKVGEKRRSVLNTACCLGLEEVAIKVLTMGASLNSYDFEGNTPIFNCLIHSQLPLLSILIQYDFDIRRQNKYGQSLLHLCLP
jgi:ankyrin repeat protein